MGDITGTGTAVTGLGGAAGFGETMLPRGDDAVAQVDVSAVFGAGFNIGDTHYDANQLYISTDGLISFGTGYAGVAADPSAIPAPFFAIFNADVDTRLDGETPESGAVWLDVDTANDCVTITWDHVGFYRRNASATDTFQMQLFDRGAGHFDVVYRYQTISWTAGDLQGGWGGLGGTAAQIAYRLAASGAVTELAASGDEGAELGLPGQPGNTGADGLWVFNVGGGGAGLIDGTNQADTLDGTSAADTIHGFGGSDLIHGSAGADLIDAGSGQDTLDFFAATTGIVIDLTNAALNSGQAAGDVYIAVEAFVATTLADTLRGGGQGDTFYGGSGDDSLDGRTGNDSLTGGDGADQLLGGSNADLLNGGAGQDSLRGGYGNDRLYGGTQSDSLRGGNGQDLLDTGNGNDNVLAGQGADTVSAGFGNDRVAGDKGGDSLTGQDGNDRLYGGPGSDQLFGGSNDDFLFGGDGRDSLMGGGGADRFYNMASATEGRDWIADFNNSAGDALYFGIAGATRADFQVRFFDAAGAGVAGVKEAYVTYIPTGKLIWVVVDGSADAAIMLHSSMNSFDIL